MPTATAMGGSVAFLFPAFSMKYRDLVGERPLEGHQDELAAYLRRATAVVEIDPRKLDRPGEFVLDDELEDDLQEHYLAYVGGAALGSLLKKRGIGRDYVAGYSMGLFAALYESQSVSFEDGLRLLRHVCTVAHAAVEGGAYGMGVIVGLASDEIAALIAGHCPKVEVADVCAPRVVVASGARADLERLFAAAEAGGAMHSRFLAVTVPFHSGFLREAEDKITAFLGQIAVRPPSCRIVSCVSQDLLVTAEDVRREASRNLWQPIRWYQTMRRLLELGVDVFLECGLSDSLCTLARNVDGNFRAYHPRKFDRLSAWHA
jgi:[acyl-carrier-protein] S-malonyltransferase